MTKKKIFCASIFTAIALVMMIIVGNAIGKETHIAKADDVDVELKLNTDTSEVYAGDEISVTLDMTKNVGLTGLRFRVDFDVDVLELVSVKASNTLPFPTVNKADEFVGYAFALINQDDDGNDCDWTVTGNILTIKFKVKDNAKFEDTKISFDMNKTDATDLAVNALNVSVEDLTLKVICRHTTTKTEVTKEATCTEKGEKVTKCTACTEVIKTEEIASKGHTSGNAEVTKEATCTEKGEKITKCTVCSEVVKTEEIAAKGHTSGIAEVTKEATCTEKGEKITKCTVCSEVVKTEEIASKGHTSGTAEVTKEATCTEKGEKVTKCTICSEVVKTEEIASKGHTLGTAEVTKEATCTEKGEKQAVCIVCKENVVEEIAAKGHIFELGTIVKEPTEKETGEMELECVVCKQVVKKDVAKTSDIKFSLVNEKGAEIKSEYEVESVVKFIADVYADNKAPQVGDIRYIPVSYKVNDVETIWKDDLYEGKIELVDVGEYNIVVVYEREIYMAAGWQSDNVQYKYNVKITAIEKKIIENETAEKETINNENKVDTPPTSDNSPIIVMTVLLLATAVVIFVLYRRKYIGANYLN